MRHSGLGASELLVLAFIAVRVLPPLRRLQQIAQQTAHALPGRLHAAEMKCELRAAAEPMPLRRELAVCGVSFSYGDPAAGPPALADVDFVVPAGRLVAVTGPSGAGKSTLADLLLGLLEPGASAIWMDGAPLDGSARHRWRRSVACVLQDPHLFYEAIRSNLLRADPGAPEEELWRALRLAAAADFVAALPDGLETWSPTAARGCRGRSPADRAAGGAAPPARAPGARRRPPASSTPRPNGKSPRRSGRCAGPPPSSR